MPFPIQERTDRGVLLNTQDIQEVGYVDDASLKRLDRASVPDDAFRPLPEQLIERYVVLAMQGALVELLEDESGWYAEIPGFEGLWADGRSEDEALEVLTSALKEWIIFKRERKHRDIPEIRGINLNRG